MIRPLITCPDCNEEKLYVMEGPVYACQNVVLHGMKMESSSMNKYGPLALFTLTVLALVLFLPNKAFGYEEWTDNSGMIHIGEDYGDKFYSYDTDTMHTKQRDTSDDLRYSQGDGYNERNEYITSDGYNTATGSYESEW